MTTPLYSIGTWDTNLQAYTPQEGLTVPSQNVPWTTLLEVVRQLRRMGYSCPPSASRKRWHEANDWSVLIKRTDGKPLDGQR